MSTSEFDRARSLEAALRFAIRSGAWVVPGPQPAQAWVGQPAPAPGAEGGNPIRGQGRAESPTGPERDPAQRLRAVREDLGDCHRCRLWEGRTHIVFGVGNPRAPLVFVGEAPGAEEDRKGEPFVGRGGQLLDRMILALGTKREDVYIANILKCRPPGNRDPNPDEAQTCLPFLWRQIDAIRPRVICALGAHAARNILGADAALGRIRGHPQRVRGWTVVPTYHPAYLLRYPAAKRMAWQDLKILKRLVEQDR